MNRIARSVIFVLAFSGQVVAAPEPAPAPAWNPYANPTSEFDERLQAAAFGEPGADRALQDWIGAHTELAVTERLRALTQLCRDYGALSWNRLRATTCAGQRALERTLRASEPGYDQPDMASTLADEPPVRAIGAAKVPLAWNALGTQSADVVVNAVTSTWMMDTGAEISVVRASLAERMGIRRVGKVIHVESTTVAVSGQAGIIDRLQIGSASVENVPVLILPDAQLKVGPGRQLDGILGLQVFVAFGRMAWIDDGGTLALGEEAPHVTEHAARIYWDEEGVGVPVRTERGVMGAFLDSGANVTHWRTAGLSLLDPKQLAGATETKMQIGGAGGVVEVKQRQLANLSFDLGTFPVRLKRIPLPSTARKSAAQVGMDAVSQFSVFILDFERMRVDGRLKK